MDSTRIRVPDFGLKKRRGEKITMITAYDTAMARLFDRAGIDSVLVGDSLGMVALGYDTTLPVTIDMMVHHAAAVCRGTRRALVIADMPFLSYQASVTEAVRNAGRLLQESGVAAVKLEGGRAVLEVVHRLVQVGIPVVGHLGLQPQSVHQLGGYRRQGTDAAQAETILADAAALEEAGAFAVVLEMVPTEVARAASARLEIPTIGIGAGPDCDGQVLVGNDMLGINDEFVPSFVKSYARLAETVVDATRAYVNDVRAGRFPEVKTPARSTKS